MEAVVAASGSLPHWVFPRPEDVFDQASEITWFQDEPYGGTSIHAQWHVFQAASDAGIKVMLDGQGADEQLAGYHSGFGLYSATLLRQGRVGQAAETIAARAPACRSVGRLPGWVPICFRPSWPSFSGDAAPWAPIGWQPMPFVPFPKPPRRRTSPWPS
jgi:hypothetical protein